MKHNQHLESYFKDLFQEYGPLKVESNLNQKDLKDPMYEEYRKFEDKNTILLLENIGMILTDGETYIRIRDLGFDVSCELTNNYNDYINELGEPNPWDPEPEVALIREKWEQQHKDLKYCILRPISVSNPQIDDKDLKKILSDEDEIDDYQKVRPLTEEQKKEIAPYLMTRGDASGRHPREAANQDASESTLNLIKRIKEEVSQIGVTAYENYTHDKSDKEYWTYMTCKKITGFINILIEQHPELKGGKDVNG